jgi:hypothetical protein
MYARFPNANFNIIAAICILLVIAEVMGMLKGEGIKIAILLGIAIVSLLAPKIQSLTVGTEGIVAALTAEIAKNGNKIEASKSATDEMDDELNQNISQLFAELKAFQSNVQHSSVVPTEAGPGRGIERVELPLTKVSDDPQKGRFGGQEERNGRRISAVVEQSASKSDWCKIVLRVTSVGKPLSGKVAFYLHDDFEPDRYIIPVTSGEATLKLRAGGAFTVGAIADDGETLLELDLATSPNVSGPADWRAR